MTGNDDVLEHFGVKGMRWGVRKEEESGGSSSSTGYVGAFRAKRAKARASDIAELRSRASVLDTKISDLKTQSQALQGKTSPADIRKRRQLKAQINLSTAERTAILKDAQAKQDGKLTSTQKHLILGGVAVAGILAGGALLAGSESGATNSAILRGKAFILRQKSPFNIDKNLARKMSPEEILKEISGPINPNYKSPGGHMNCRRCTYAYELRRRGYDVHATTAVLGTGQSESGVINALTPGSDKFINRLSLSQSIAGAGGKRSTKALGDTRTSPVAKSIIEGLQETKRSTISSSYKVLKALETQPNGARGEVMFNFGSFGHSMQYEIINGKAHIFDSQKAKLYTASKPVESVWDGFHSAEITRLDNVDLDIDFLTRWATNR